MTPTPLHEYRQAHRRVPDTPDTLGHVRRTPYERICDAYDPRLERTENVGSIPRWACRLEDASGYGVLLIASASVLATDAYLWLTFGPWLFATLAAACGSVAAARVRAVWPLLLALGCFLSAAFAAYVALGLFALVARMWTALMGVPA